MAETTSQVITQITPNAGKKLLIIKAVSAADGGTITVASKDLQKIEGCIGFSTTGIPASYDVNATTGVITINNGSTLTWNFIVWGY